ncbi:MAG: UDP-N-acetylmuramoyl-L-alanyl-D-glutamate--2,6-diaminopimelate ligase [Treponema sp.]|jgi:UDP-N-acetylmuramoyl-L-alanyl-D-glutamate--2,6-diaminopimelate ligase|nr:UDP-N-acetylmuramoyl-L-alanyl-D-glutamate--2,6-diaminopimelate ligase [Treponema sp.]
MQRRLSEFFTPETARKSGYTDEMHLPPELLTLDPRITALEYDSRKVEKGALYFALPGLHADGHQYIDDAILRGALVIVHEAEIPLAKKNKGVVYLQVKDSRFAMSPIAAAFYGFPSRRLTVIGVTGTEGKSTTVYLIFQLLRLMGKRAGFFSTVEYCVKDKVCQNPEHQTTPEASAVQRLLCEMVENGLEYAVVEASSHGLSPRTNRLGDVDFDAAVFTNVTHEHLEFHGTWEQYRDDKANLFRALDKRHQKHSGNAPAPFGIINADDPSADYFAEATKQRTRTFSARGIGADISIRSIESSAWGNWYETLIAGENEAIDIRDKLPGAFNAGNVLAALLTVSGLLRLPVRELIPLTPRLLPVKGRMTSIKNNFGFEVLVDYAHTPSSFLTIFPPLRDRINKTGGRIISLFGSAGERDTKKRAEQGKIAAEYCDIVILTDEDPRGEKPMDILEEIAKGCEATQGCETKTRGENLFLIPDRPQAIRKAFSLARDGDIVLLLGKGHENSIIYADKTIPYDEIAEAEKALKEMA